MEASIGRVRTALAAAAHKTNANRLDFSYCIFSDIPILACKGRPPEAGNLTSSTLSVWKLEEGIEFVGGRTVTRESELVMRTVPGICTKVALTPSGGEVVYVNHFFFVRTSKII